MLSSVSEVRDQDHHRGSKINLGVHERVHMRSRKNISVTKDFTNWYQTVDTVPRRHKETKFPLQGHKPKLVKKQNIAVKLFVLFSPHFSTVHFMNIIQVGLGK